MNRVCFICLFPCLTATLLFSQPNPVSLVDPSAKLPSPTSTMRASQGNLESQARILDSYGTLPLSFEMNHGQTDARVKFLSRTGGFSLFLTGDEAVFALHGKKSNRGTSQKQEPESLGVSSGTLWRNSRHALEVPPFPIDLDDASSTRGDAATESETYSVLRMKLHNANPRAAVTGMDERAGINNYFIGNDPARWRTNVPTYAKVKYVEIYSGVDLVYYGNERQLEYDFIVAPGANPRRIAFDVRGAKRIRRDAHGDLVFKMGEDEIRWHKPVVYQERNGTRQVVAANYVITNDNRVGFEIAEYDTSRTLYVDPLIYSTYLGGSGYEIGRAIAVDGAGNAYVTGRTFSTDFPTTAGSFQTAPSEAENIFVTKFNPSGSALVYSTYLGGSGSPIAGDIGASIAVDGSGNAFLTGTTYSGDFPTTAGAFQTAIADSNFGAGDGFVTKLNPTGSGLVYSSYLGGSSREKAESIAVDSGGDAYVTGFTASSDFPVTPGAFQTTNGGDGKGFVTKFNATGSALIYSTFLGGTLGAFEGGHGYGIAVDSSGSAFVTGLTDSEDFPTTPGAFQSSCDGGGFGCSPNAFVTKFNPTGSGLVYSTFLGGTDDDWGMGVALDRLGNAYVTGTTYSRDFPTTSGGFQTTCGGAGNNFSHCWDAFVTKINPDGSALVYSNYLGGTNDDWGIGITVDSSGQAYVIGYTESFDFPTKYPLQPTIFGGISGFVTKIGSTGALAYSTYLGEIPGLTEEGVFVVEPNLGIALDRSGNAYVIGETFDYNFPTMNPLQPFLNGPADAFVAKISAEPSDITLSPLHWDFRNQPTGVASDSQVSVLNNAGSTSLTITSISITGTNSGDFAQVNNCGASLQPGTSCSITVTFTPTALGNRSAAVKIVDSSPRQWISLTGLGLLDTVTKLTSNKNPSALGKPVTFRATVSAPSGGTPTGFVNVSDPAGGLVLRKELQGGTTSFTTTKLPLGLNAFTVQYVGDATYGYSEGSLNQDVLAASTTTTLTSLPNPSAYGQAVTFTAIVTPSTGALPDGEVVSFMEGKTVLGTGTLNHGSASFTTATLAAAKDAVEAIYGGDSNFIGSSSKIQDQVVDKATTTTTLVSSRNPSSVGQSVTFTANVAPQYGGAVKGNVTFYDGTTKLATVSLSGTPAKLTTSKLTAGSHTISATYAGSTSFTGSSASMTQTVN
jgi:Bacterial Ig-like domain (group 3)/Beta-propeller repeat/Transmembrane protein 131-like N-terminal